MEEEEEVNSVINSHNRRTMKGQEGPPHKQILVVDSFWQPVFNHCGQQMEKENVLSCKLASHCASAICGCVALYIICNVVSFNEM